MFKHVLLATVFATSTASADLDYIDKSPYLLDGCANEIVNQFNELGIPVPKFSTDSFVDFIPEQFRSAVIGQLQACIHYDLRPSIEKIQGVLSYPKGEMI